MRSTPLLLSLPDPFWPRVGAHYRFLSIGRIELNCVLTLDWITWNRTDFQLHTYAKLNCLKWNCFCMLNWNFWIRTVFDVETVLTFNWILWYRTVLTFDCKQKYTYKKTELLEIKLFICIIMDLALNNLQKLICHKTQTNKPYSCV